MPFDCMPSNATPGYEMLPYETTYILESVERLLLKPRHWTKAVMESGPWWNRRYCLVGALVHVTRRKRCIQSFPEVRNHLNNVANRYGFPTIEALNDHQDTTHNMVMHVLREAIQQAEVVQLR